MRLSALQINGQEDGVWGYVDKGGIKVKLGDKKLAEQICRQRGKKCVKISTDDEDAGARQRSFAQTSNSVDESINKIEAVKRKIAKLKKELAELPSNPGSQEGYDALDDAKSEIKAAEAELAALRGMVKENTATAAAAYTARQQHVGALMKDLHQLLVEHAEAQSQNPDSWGFPGDLAHVTQELQNIIDFLSTDRDY